MCQRYLASRVERDAAAQAACIAHVFCQDYTQYLVQPIPPAGREKARRRHNGGCA